MPGITNQILDAMAALATGATGIAKSYVTSVPEPYVDGFPFWLHTPAPQHIIPRYSSFVGDDYVKPSWFCFHYIISNDPQASIDIPSAQRRMHDDVDLYVDAFRSEANVTLGGLVEETGFMIDVNYNPDGPFVEFNGNICLGTYGLIAVVHTPRSYGCPP